MKKLLNLLFVFSLSFNLVQAQNIDAGPDQVSVCGSPVTFKATVYKGWSPVKTPSIPSSPLNSVCFINENVGFIGGFGKIYKTDNKGRNWWETYYSTELTYYYTVYFLNETKGFAAGSEGKMLMTVNGGDSWTPITTDGVTAFKSIWFTTNQIGFAVGTAGAIFKTTNGGTTWTKTIFNATHSYNAVRFTSPTSGYIVGNNSILLKTNDGGVTWTQTSLSANTITLFAIDFSSNETGFICGNLGSIYKTIDGGENWSKYTADSIYNIESPTVNGKVFKAAYFKSICFTHADTGYLGGYNGANALFAKTTDGGKTWLEIKSTLKYKADAMTFVKSSGIGYAVGNLGRVATYYEKSTSETLSDFNWTDWNFYNFSTADTATAYPTSYTEYKVTAFNSSGQMVSDSVSVKVEPLALTSKIKYTQSEGGLVTLDNYQTNYPDKTKLTYKWTPSTGLSSDDVPFPTTTMNSPTKQYQLTITSPNSCTANVMVVLKDSLTATAVALNSVVCKGDVKLSASSNYSGTGQLKYKWTPSTGLNNDTIANPIASITESKTYELTITTPAGITASAQVIATVKSFEVNAGIDRTLRCGGSFTNNASVNYTGSNLKYKWTPSTGLSNDTILNPVFSPSANTVYRLTVTTPDGCTSFDEMNFTITAYTVNAGADKSIICGASVQLDSVTTTASTGTKLKYKWTPSTGLNNDTIANPVATPIVNTTYTVQVYTASGCSYSDNVLVSVSPLTFDLGANKTVTCGSNAQLGIASSNGTIPPGSKYKWTPASGLSNDTIVNPVATPTTNTTYTLTITTPHGCVVSDNVLISVQATQKPAISYVAVSNANKNVINWNMPTSGRINLFNVYKETNVTNNYLKIGTVQPAETMTFVDTLSNPDIQSNKYKISLLDECGFESALSDSHKTMHLTINKGVGNIWNLIWESYEGFVVSTYNIYRGSTKQNIQIIGSLSGSNNQFSDYSAPTGEVYYQIEAVASTTNNVKTQRVIQSSSLESVARITTRSNIATNKGGVDGIYDVNLSDKIRLYPNPVNDVLRILSDEPVLKAEIYAVNGQLLKLECSDNISEMSFEDLSKGSYFIKLYSKSATITRIILRK